MAGSIPCNYVANVVHDAQKAVLDQEYRSCHALDCFTCYAMKVIVVSCNARP